MSIVMDDFGNGRSSLACLRTFRFDKIKIDGSFIQHLADDPGAVAIVRAVVGLSGALGVITNAEGVETAGGERTRHGVRVLPVCLSRIRSTSPPDRSRYEQSRGLLQTLQQNHLSRLAAVAGIFWSAVASKLAYSDRQLLRIASQSVRKVLARGAPPMAESPGNADRTMLAGTWKLIAWRRIAEHGPITYPLGEDASGLLIYTADGRMAVQMAAADRPSLTTADPLGGDAEERAAAYSTCLAYFGSYEVHGNSVVHRIDASLYPNWSGAEQSRPFTCDGSELVLRTPPVEQETGTVVNEMSWVRQV